MASQFHSQTSISSNRHDTFVRTRLGIFVGMPTYVSWRHGADRVHQLHEPITGMRVGSWRTRPDCLRAGGAGFGDGLLAVGEALLETGDLLFQAADLGLARVDRIIGLAHPGQSGLELLAQAGAGAGTVKGGPVDACFVGEGGDVADAAVIEASVADPAVFGTLFDGTAPQSATTSPGGSGRNRPRT
jgi:hypothetical protein